MNAILWVVVLLLVGLSVMALEVFVPSGGVLGFVSITAIIAAVATAFLELGPVAGMAVLAVTVLAVPAVLALAFRWFPETPLGRRVLPLPPNPDDLLPDAQLRRSMHALVGRSGRAQSPLLPWGSVEIDGLPVEALSESGSIEAGAAVEAVGVQGTAIIVRQIETGIGDQMVQPEPLESAQSLQPKKEGVETGSRLSKTLEEFEFERLRPPSA
ncbi:MAG: hypothetical protein CK530_10315 [Planctomycetaceae bacterium]|nr:MAG: hypothetical protein CK530_10315 [Planctomycetaceae bacterium]